jgi:1-aminocyclopropane-1-carboxylate deaminase
MPIDPLENSLGITHNAIEQRLTLSWPGAARIELWVKRDDLIHPIISGNKWRKLKYALIQAQAQGHTKVLSFGGGFSNHLHALGYCCQALGIHLTAIVRGNYSLNPSPMLQDLARWATQIQYVDRNTYQKRTDSGYLAKLKDQYNQPLIIPEGGSQQQALTGVGEIIQELTQSYDFILAPVASGGTLAGLINGLRQHKLSGTQVVGIAVLKGQDYLETLVTGLLPKNSLSTDWQINHQYHFGGYGKKPAELAQFCDNFLFDTQIAIEPVYSGKLFFATQQLIAQEHFPRGSKILVLHTGGLQGAR